MCLAECDMEEKRHFLRSSHLKSGDILSKDSRHNVLTVLTVSSFSETHLLESVVHISPPEWRLCTARERKLSRHHKAHCVSRTCKLSWRRSVQRGPKRSWVFTLQSVHCLSAHFTLINATQTLSFCGRFHQ